MHTDRLDDLLDRLRTPTADPDTAMSLVDDALVLWDERLELHISGRERMTLAELRDHLRVLDAIHEAGRAALGAPASSRAVH
jgi:hypothetical protein